MKASAVAPSNIAFIKYWGKKNGVLRLPENGSLSMNLNNLLTTTTVEFSADYSEDSVIVDGKKKPNNSETGKRIIEHLNRVREMAKIDEKAKVVSKNNFPMGTGLSSSASGIAALTVSAAKAAGLELSEKNLSILARQGSGSACRSIPDGIVEWIDGNANETSYAVSLFPPDHWDIVDVVILLSSKQKTVSTTEGQKLASSSPFFSVRLSKIKEKIAKIKNLIRLKNFPEFGELIEAEALELHAIMLTSTPSLIYWLPETVRIIKLVKDWRHKGLPVYFTVNTGQNVHLICKRENLGVLTTRLKKIQEIRKTIVNTPSNGARLINDHLF